MKRRLTRSKCCLASKQAKPVDVCAWEFGTQRAGQTETLVVPHAEQVGAQLLAGG